MGAEYMLNIPGTEAMLEAAKVLIKFLSMASGTAPILQPILRRPTSLIPPKATFDSPGSGLETSTSTLTTSTELRELEFRKQLLNDKWRQLFDKYDPEGFGEIPWEDFVEVLKTPEFVAEVAPNTRDILAERAQERKSPAITFQDFVNIMSGKRRRSFLCAVHQRDREISSENDFHIGKENPPFSRRMAHLIAAGILPDERDRKYYADHYTCFPPPLFIILITFIELGVFTYYTITTGEMSPSRPVPIDSIFIYRSDKRLQIWRFIFYMVLHAGWLHLIFNLLVQLLVGLPLEMVHGSTRIGIVYMAGVLAGSLGTSVFDANVYLVGASGGVYALLAAHLANVLLNFHHMQFGLVRLLGIFFIASVDVGFAVYDRYAAEHDQGEAVSYAAHLMGAFAGLSIGLAVLKNFAQKLHEQLIWWVALTLYVALATGAVIYNVLHPYETYQQLHWR